MIDIFTKTIIIVKDLIMQIVQGPKYGNVQPQNSGTASTPLNRHCLPGHPSFKDKVWSANVSKCRHRPLEQVAKEHQKWIHLFHHSIKHAKLISLKNTCNVKRL
jgi:hypothetical protein